MATMFALVEFENENLNAGNELAVVPALWLHRQDRRCYWPNRMNKKSLEKIVKKNEPFKSTWPSYRVHKVHSKTENYENADKDLEDLLRDSRSEAEQSGKSTVSLQRKTLVEEDNQDDEENIPASRHASSTPSLPSTLTVCSSGSISSSNALDVIRKLSEVEDKVTTILERVITTETFVDQQQIILSELLRNSRAMAEAKAENIEAPTDLPRFPIASNEEFNQFNERLEDRVFYKYMVTRLAAIGGSGIESVTRRILKYLLSDSVAQKYNWKGRDKISFEKLTAMRLIYEAAKLNFPINERSDMVVANTVKDWLKFAKTRIIGAQKRQQ